MEAIKLDIEQKLHELCTITSSDFSAIADINPRNQAIQWKFAYGNNNDRYKHMIGKPGKDLSGSVVRFGTTIVLDAETVNYEQQRMQYPIMIAENLFSAIAVPVQWKGKINGVLLVGSRMKKRYSIDQINQIKSSAEQFSLYYNALISDTSNESH